MKNNRKIIAASALAVSCGIAWLWIGSARAHFAVSLTLGKAGLSSLRYMGRQMLKSGDFHVNRVVLKDQAGRAFDADLTSIVRVVPERGEVERVYTWGTVTIRYLVSGSNRVTLTIRTKNTSRFSIQSLSYEPFTFKFPVKPREYDGSTPLLGHNIGMPTAITVTFNSDFVMLVNEDVQKPLLIGFPWALDRPASTEFPVRVNTGRDSMYPDSLPFVDRSISPGQSDEYQLAVIFGKNAAGVSTSVPNDLWAKYASAYPSTLNWDDRRPIGRLELATGGAGSRTNPRGWFVDPNLDVTTAEGGKDLESRLMAYVDQSAAILREMNAQGAIVWDIEGSQFKHAINYVGDPHQLGSLAPEMERLADRFFARLRDLGFRVGVCIRPQMFKMDGAGNPRQVESSDPFKVLVDKIAYARKRWDATLFYINSNGDQRSPLDPEIIHRVAAAFPDVLLIPERSNVRYYAYSAPYYDLRQSPFMTADSVRSIYPKAFSIINTTDGPVDQHYDELVTAVTQGDILLYRAWYREPVQSKLKTIYESSQAALPTFARPFVPALAANLAAVSGAPLVPLALTK